MIQALKCYFSRKLRISLYLSFLTFTGTTTLLKCFNDLQCGGVGVSPENYLALNKQKKWLNKMIVGSTSSASGSLSSIPDPGSNVG